MPNDKITIGGGRRGYQIDKNMVRVEGEAWSKIRS